MRTLWLLALLGCAAPPPRPGFHVELPPPADPDALLDFSPFGVNTALRPDAPDVEARLLAMRQAGVKWGRQDFGWARIDEGRVRLRAL